MDLRLGGLDKRTPLAPNRVKQIVMLHPWVQMIPLIHVLDKRETIIMIGHGLIHQKRDIRLFGCGVLLDQIDLGALDAFEKLKGIHRNSQLTMSSVRAAIRQIS